MSGLYEQQFDCDAPPYPVVAACEELGFQSPLDVRWCRMRTLLVAPSAGSGLLGWLFGRSHSAGRCACGQPFPTLQRYILTFKSKMQALYLLGQCRRCHKIFWEKE
jgi:hypothetical protein